MKVPCDHKFDKVGPGGRKCNCCYPAPGKNRRFSEKTAKRKRDQFIKKEISIQLEEETSK